VAVPTGVPDIVAILLLKAALTPVGKFIAYHIKNPSELIRGVF